MATLLSAAVVTTLSWAWWPHPGNYRPITPGDTGLVTALLPDRSVEAVKALKELAKELRMELARRVKLRHVPELHFHYDDSVDRGERIETLLRENPPGAADE